LVVVLNTMRLAFASLGDLDFSITPSLESHRHLRIPSSMIDDSIVGEFATVLSKKVLSKKP
jgi:hypothetical protein